MRISAYVPFIYSASRCITSQKEGNILSLTSDNFQKEVVESELPVVVDAFATWCPPCKAMAPIFWKLSEEFKGKVKFVKLDVDQEKQLAAKLNIQAMPTFLFYNKGNIVNIHRGYLEEEALASKIHEFKPRNGSSR